MNSYTCYLFIIITVVFSMFVGMAIGAKTMAQSIKDEAIEKGVGVYSVNRDTGKVKFYWLTGGTNVVAYKENK
jgi:hypothetical protein